MSRGTQSNVVRALIYVLLVLNLLDITTSLFPSPADHLWPIPERSTGRFYGQLFACLPLIWLLPRWGRGIWRALREASVPPLPAVALLTFVVVASVHVAFRYERFPFSPVAMFSSGVTPRTDDAVRTEGYVVVDGEGQLAPIGLLLEGNRLFGRFDMDWDYKSGWAMFMYAYVQRQARDELLAELRARGYTQVKRTRYVYDRRDGRLLWPRLKSD